MAFNPFHWFRKHQKAAFAGLIIVCMFVFIASFGVGDAVQQLLGLVRSKHQQGEVVATVYGDKVYEGDLTDLARKRQAASQFLFYATYPEGGLFPLLRPPFPSFMVPPSPAQKYTKTLDDLLEGDLKEPPAPVAHLKSIVQATREQHLHLTKYGIAKNQAPNQAALGIIEHQTALYANNIRTSFGDLMRLAAEPEVRDNPKYMELVRKVTVLVGQAYHRAQVIATPVAKLEDLYFGGNSHKVEDLLDFLIWKKQADKLGINLTDQGLRKQINEELLARDFLSSKEDFVRNAEVKKFVQSLQGEGGRRRPKGVEGGVTAEELRDAILDELRVAYAQSAVLGLERGARSYRQFFPASIPPSFGTPDEFLNFYRDRRTTLNVRLLPLPIEKFRNDPKVTSRQPADADLRELYEKNKDREPSPARREPGFKRPQRIAFAYVTAVGKDEESKQAYRSYYVRPARRQLETSPAVQRFTTGASLAPGGTGPAGCLALLGAPLFFDPLLADYDNYLNQTDRFWKLPSDVTAEAPAAGTGWMPDSATVRPEIGPATVGSASAAWQGLSALTTLAAYGARYRTQDTLRFYTQLQGARIAPPVPGAFAADRYVSSFLLACARAQPAPLSVVRPVLLEQMAGRVAELTLRTNRDAYAKEVAKLKELPDENERLTKAREKAEEYHFTYHQMPGPLSRLEVLADLKKGDNELDLAALVEGYAPGATPEQFVEVLFRPRGPRPPGLFDPLRFHAERLEDVENGYFWRTREVPSEVMKYAAVYNEVREAWYLDKARAVARAEAKRLQEQVNEERAKGKHLSAILADLESRYASKYGEMFELTDVAKLARPKAVQFTQHPGGYSEYRVPQDLRNKFPYPPAKLVDELVKLQHKGQATVIADRPARTFYLAVLEERNDQTGRNLEELHKVFRDGTKTQGAPDQLYQMFRAWQADETRRRAMEQLRREALKDDGKVGKDGYVIPDDVRRRVEGRGESESDRRREEEEGAP